MNLSKKVIAALVVICMFAAYFIPVKMFKVFAEGTVFTITFQVGEGTHTITQQDGKHLVIDEKIVDFVDGDNNPVEVDVTANSNVATVSVPEGKSVKFNYNTGNYSVYSTSGHTLYDNSNPSMINSNSVFLVENKVEVLEDIAVKVTFTGTEGEVSFNEGAGHTDEGKNYTGTLEKAGYTSNTKVNKIKVCTSFGMQPAKKITINGVQMPDISGLDENEFEVEGAGEYIIDVEADSQAVTPKTIIWVNPDFEPKTEEDKKWVKDFSIGHGYAKAIEVYDTDNHKLAPADYINTTVQPDGSKSDDYGLNNGFGWVKILPGYKVVFDFVPEYGYQLTSITINGVEIKATATMNRFEFTMPDGSGNIHFAATFTKTEDVVKANSDKVAGGTVSMGDNKLDGGSVQIKVSDADVEPEKIKGFEGAAGDYKVSNILDIDLYNVFYKGKADSDDVWANQIEELDGWVTITIQLADDVDGNEIVLVHNIHDGEEYEVIPTTYDSETHTLTFRTKSFSNYAIASKTVEKAAETAEEKKSDTPNTGDTIIASFAAFALAGVSLMFVKRAKTASKIERRYKK